jgi:endonuclease YncB( thermonuclease family)
MKVFALLALLCSLNAWGEILTGKVVGVSDGDTLTVLVDLKPVKIRVAGIDAPEKAQPFGQRSKQALSECAFGKVVEVEWNKVDRYGRTLGKVISGDVDCGLLQVESGLAWHYKAYVKEQPLADQVLYDQAEQEARYQKKGLWVDPMPKPPWDFRHKK